MTTKQSTTFQQESKREQSEKFKQTSDLAKVIHNILPISYVCKELEIHFNKEDKTTSFFNPEERTPSMSIFHPINKVKCFSSGKTANSIELVKIVMNVDFFEAVEILTKMLNKYKLGKTNNIIFSNNKFLIEKDVMPCEQLNYQRLVKAHYSKTSDSEKSKAFAKLKLKQKKTSTQIKIYKFISNTCKKDGFSKKAIEYLTGNERKLSFEIIKKFGIFE
jgi:DNA primase